MGLTILAFTECYLPGYRGGGPIHSIANLVDGLGDVMTFRVVCCDHDYQATKPYAGVLVDTWNPVGKSRVFYASSKTLSWRGMRGLLRSTPHDVLYLNSYFNVRFTILPLLLRALREVPRKPVVLAPRGEFSLGALRVKRLKKRGYMAVVRGLGLYKGITWQASTVYERDDIRRALPFVPDSAIQIAMDLAANGHPGKAQQLNRIERRTGDALRLCFLSRLSPTKNLDYALRCLRHTAEPVHFTIFGPKEDPVYWSRCEALIASLPAHVTVQYAGEVEHAHVGEALASQDLFFLPTRGENYGHVIQEALVSGLPVLISDQTPWRGLQDDGVGWVLPLARHEAYAEVIDEVARLPVEDLLEMRTRATAYAHAKATDPQTLQANMRLFMGVMHGVAK